MGAFMGFADFDCNQEVWNGLLKGGDYGMSKYFSKMLSLEDVYQKEQSSFSKYKTGFLYWDFRKDPFLNYSKNEDVYKDRWLKMWEQPSAEQKKRKRKQWTPPTEEKCRRVFEHFKNSIPREEDAAAPEEREWLVPAAKMVYHYLVEIEKALDECSDTDTKEKSRCLAAGVYSLSAFFMQNNALCDNYYIPTFCCPPPAFNPVSEETMAMLIKKSEEDLPQRKLKAKAVIPPDTELHSPEADGDEPATQKTGAPSDVDTELQTCCHICGEDTIFNYHDDMGKWCAYLNFFRKWCLFLVCVFGLIFILLTINSGIVEYNATYSNWLSEQISSSMPSFYAGFADLKDLHTALLVTTFFCGILYAVFFFYWNVYKKSILTLEEERGYRWVRYKCSKCKSQYMKKVHWQLLADSEESCDEFVLECIYVPIIILVSIMIAAGAFSQLPAAYYRYIPALTLVVPLLLVNGLIRHKLYKQLTQLHFVLPRDVNEGNDESEDAE